MQGLLSLFFVAVSLLVSCEATPLDDYVWKHDDSYGWTDLGADYVAKGRVLDRGYTSYTLNLTSQRWLTDDAFSPSSAAKSLWWHHLVVIVPDDIRHTNNASLWITGGSQTSSPPVNTDEDILVSASLAVTTGTITAVLFQIPNERIIFASDPIQKSRGEDAIIAFTWAHFLDDPSQPEWLVRFPMVKASLRAMDATQEFIRTKHAYLNANIDYFSVSGASKRGWTTWLVGAVDPDRVKLIAPVVLDAINFVAVEHHQYRSYGGWTYALQDYVDMNITYRFDDPNMVKLQELEDPYWYRHRLTMPKMVVNAVMDEFQQPDDTHYWWADMPEPKHFLIAPNAEHSLATGIFVAVPAISAWIAGHLNNAAVPKFDWTINKENGEIVATIESGIVHSAEVWWATSCGANAFDGVNRRDYRIAHLDNPCGCGVVVEGMCTNLKSFWNKKTLESSLVKGKRTYRAKFDAPEDGRWVASLIDIKFVNSAVPSGLDPSSLNAAFVSHPDTPAGRLAVSFSRYFENFGGFPHDFAHFFEFTTEVSVFPDSFPYPDCQGAACGEVPIV